MARFNTDRFNNHRFILLPLQDEAKPRNSFTYLTSAYGKLRDKGKILNLHQLYNNLNIPIKLADT